MSDYERGTIERDIKARLEQAQPMIEAGVLGEFEATIEALQAAEKRANVERAREITRWDPGRLADEIKLMQTRIDTTLSRGHNTALGGSSSAEAIQALYQEAKDSGDPVKQRAACEVLRGVLGKFSGAPQETRLAVNRVAMAAEQDLRQLRTTEGLELAHQKRGEALQALGEKREQLREVSRELGEGDPTMPFAMGNLTRAFKRVQQDRDTGQVRILAPDAPEVTGIYVKGEPEVAG